MHHETITLGLTPLSGPSDLLLFGLFGWAFVVLPAMGALLPVTIHGLSRRTKVVTITGSIAVVAPVLWFELYRQGAPDPTVFSLVALILGAYVAESISLVHQGNERGEPTFSLVGAGLGLLFVVGLVVA